MIQQLKEIKDIDQKNPYGLIRPKNATMFTQNESLKDWNENNTLQDCPLAKRAQQSTLYKHDSYRQCNEYVRCQ